MKRLLTIAMMAVLTLTAGAQGKWKTGMYSGDELLGTQAKRYYNYEMNGVGWFTVDDWNGWSFRVTTLKGVFDRWVTKYYNGKAPDYYVKANIGLYDMQGNLLDKMYDNLQMSYKDPTFAWVNEDWTYSRKHKKFLKNAIKALKEGSGYVRIVIPRKSMPDFDIKVMPYKE